LKEEKGKFGRIAIEGKVASSACARRASRNNLCMFIILRVKVRLFDLAIGKGSIFDLEKINELA
jgi:hypothetical protein